MKRCSKCGKVKPLSEFYGRGDGQGGDGRKSACASCECERRRAYVAANHASVLEADRVRALEKRRRTRAKVFDHYGWWCACCGSPENLCVDHVLGDGRQQRGRDYYASGDAVFRWLIRNHFPPGYQTLCRPCNISKQSGPCCWLLHADRPEVVERRRRAFDLRSAGVSIEERAAVQGVPLATAAMDDIWIAGRAGMVVLRRLIATEPERSDG